MTAWDTDRIESRAKEIMNLASTWAGDIEAGTYSAEGLTAARIEAQMEVLRAIASNPNNGYHGSLCAVVDANHNDFLSAHDGEIGVPQIVPFEGAAARDGVPARPDQIDAWRANPESFTGVLDTAVAHDEDDDDNPSPLSCRYSDIGGFFKFTGYSAKVPMIQLARDTEGPETLESIVVKLIPSKLVKPGSKITQIAQGYLMSGLADLAELRGSSRPVISPIPDVQIAQKLGAA